MKLWDTETGQCLKRFGNGKTPYVIKFHPDEDKQNIFLAGMSDKKIIQVRQLLLSSPSIAHRLSSTI
jgi:pre-mRNA-processing factor 17